METIRKAFFVSKPRILTDLMVPHDLNSERAFLVAKRIELRATEYENFVTDLLVERYYIEEAADWCQNNDVPECLLICERGNTDGVLVIPNDSGSILYAAFYKK